MPDPDALAPAFEALDDCDVALHELERLCCEPGRSPRMAALAETLGETRAGLDGLGDDPGAVLTLLEDAGSQVGWLQVGCCAPGRLPLYARLLENLNSAQLALNRALGTGH